MSEWIVTNMEFTEAWAERYGYKRLVRCKDCKHFKRDIPCVGGTYNGCDQLEGMDGCEPYVEDDFFCAYGERKADV